MFNFLFTLLLATGIIEYTSLANPFLIGIKKSVLSNYNISNDIKFIANKVLCGYNINIVDTNTGEVMGSFKIITTHYYNKNVIIDMIKQGKI